MADAGDLMSYINYWLYARGLHPMFIAAQNYTDHEVRLVGEWYGGVNAVDKKGRCPVHCAVIKGNSDVIEALSLLGADLDAVDHKGRTAMHFAAQTRSPVETVEMLLELGSYTYWSPDDYGNTPRDYLTPAHAAQIDDFLSSRSVLETLKIARGIHRCVAARRRVE